MTARRLSSWIDGFLDLTADKPTPKIFREWTAISAVAAAMERRCWTPTYGGMILYPNLYLMILGVPGGGKTVPTKLVYEIYRDAFDKVDKDSHYIAPTSLTRAALADKLSLAKVKIVDFNKEPALTSYNSLYVIANEIDTLLNEYNADFMAILTDVYDCGRFVESIRYREEDIDVPNAQINMIGCGTPSWLLDFLPPTAWEKGFMSRQIMVYSDERVTPKLVFAVEGEEYIEPDTLDTADLIHDLKLIGAMFGRFHWTKPAIKEYNTWFLARMPPVPQHPRLSYYLRRRHAHLYKLCMVASASKSDELLVTLDDYELALGWLLNVEASMSGIFKAMTSGGPIVVMRDTWDHIYELYIKSGKKPVPEEKIFAFLHERVSSHYVALDVIKGMLGQKLIKEDPLNFIGMCYTPQKKPI